MRSSNYCWINVRGAGISFSGYNDGKVTIRSASLDSARYGQIENLKLLMKRCAAFVGEALVEAASENELEAAKLLMCSEEAKSLTDFNDHVLKAFDELLDKKHCLDMAVLLVNQCGEDDLMRALDRAVTWCRSKMTGVIAAKCNEAGRERAVVKAALTDSVKMVKTLLQYCSQDTVGRALCEIVSTKEQEISMKGVSDSVKLLLDACDSSTMNAVLGQTPFKRIRLA